MRIAPSGKIRFTSSRLACALWAHHATNRPTPRVRFRTVRRSSTLRRHVLTHHGALRFFQQRTSAVRKNLHVYSCSASFHLILRNPGAPLPPAPYSSESSTTPPPPPPEPPYSLFAGSCVFESNPRMIFDVQI